MSEDISLSSIAARVQSDFEGLRPILSFDQFLGIFREQPRRFARDAVQRGEPVGGGLQGHVLRQLAGGGGHEGGEDQQLDVAGVVRGGELVRDQPLEIGELGIAFGRDAARLIERYSFQLV